MWRSWGNDSLTYRNRMYHILIFFEKLKERKKKCDRLEEVGDVWGNDESSSFKKLKQKWMNVWSANEFVFKLKEKKIFLFDKNGRKKNKICGDVTFSWLFTYTARHGLCISFVFFFNEFCFTKNLYKIVIDTYSLHWRQWSWNFQYF